MQYLIGWLRIISMDPPGLIPQSRNLRGETLWGLRVSGADLQAEKNTQAEVWVPINQSPDK